MQPNFHHKPVNGPFDDPCVFVRIMREKRAFLFDCGYISKLGARDIQKITDVFITHTHIDHFIGFDILLRSILRRECPLKIYGPANIIRCVEGKLQGYTWNFIKEYPLKIEVFEINNGRIKHSGFSAENCLKRADYNEKPFDGIVLKESGFEIRAECLVHHIPSLGYSLKEDFHVNIDKIELENMGLPIGRWLSEFKKSIRENASDEKEFSILNKKYKMKELKNIAKITKGQKISYVMDSAMDDANIKKIITLAKDSDTFYCEAHFLEEDRGRALERHHLTAGTAGMIAREAGVKNLVVMHFSPKYNECPDAPVEEAMKEFKKDNI